MLSACFAQSCQRSLCLAVIPNTHAHDLVQLLTRIQYLSESAQLYQEEHDRNTVLQQQQLNNFKLMIFIPS